MFLHLLGYFLVILCGSLFTDKFIAHAKSQNIGLPAKEAVDNVILTAIIVFGIWLIQR